MRILLNFESKTDLLQVEGRLLWDGVQTRIVVRWILFVSKTVGSKHGISSLRTQNWFTDRCPDPDLRDGSGNAPETCQLWQRPSPVCTFWFFRRLGTRTFRVPVLRRRCRCRQRRRRRRWRVVLRPTVVRVERQLQVCLRQRPQFFVIDQIHPVPLIRTIVLILEFGSLARSFWEADPSSWIKSAESVIRHSARVVIHGRAVLPHDVAHDVRVVVDVVTSASLQKSLLTWDEWGVPSHFRVTLAKVILCKNK